MFTLLTVSHDKERHLLNVCVNCYAGAPLWNDIAHSTSMHYIESTYSTCSQPLGRDTFVGRGHIFTGPILNLVFDISKPFFMNSKPKFNIFLHE